MANTLGKPTNQTKSIVILQRPRPAIPLPGQLSFPFPVAKPPKPTATRRKAR